jgi:hypothetical protein
MRLLATLAKPAACTNGYRNCRIAGDLGPYELPGPAFAGPPGNDVNIGFSLQPWVSAGRDLDAARPHDRPRDRP